jgi:hypothetical protein
MRSVLLKRGNTLPNPAQRVLIPYTPLKLTDLNPLMRNDNVTTDAQEAKVGPSAWLYLNGLWHGWVEGIQGTGFPANNGMTAMMKVTAPTLQGPYTFSPATTRIRDASDTTTWEYYEHSFADIVPSRGSLVAMYHGGNNNGPQHMGLDYTGNITDGSSGWAADSRNPVLVCGSSGAWDDRQCGNDFKIAKYHNKPGNPWTGALWGVYRGRKTGTFTDGMTGRATISADYRQYTKDPPATAGQVIFSAPSWNSAGGRTAGTPVFDKGGRAHMWYPGGPNGIGKSYSDDDGFTWSDENGGAQVLAPTGVVGDPDKTSIGDVVQTFFDGDVAFLLYGTENISDFPTNSPMRGQSGALVPFPDVSPLRRGKFHLTSSRTNVDTTGANAIVSPLNLTIFSMCGRFRAYRTSRATPRRLYAEVDAVDTFNRSFNVAIESATGSGLGAAGAGRLHVFFRTSGGIVNLWSDVVVDDTLWHTWLLRRIGLASWEFYVDGVLQTGTNGASSTSVSLDSTAVNKCIGNMPTTSGTPNQPSNCTQSNVHLCNGYAMTAAEANALMANGTAPPSGTLTISWPTVAYTDSGNVVTVEAAENWALAA